MANNIDERLLAAQLADQQRQARMGDEDKGRQGQMAETDKERQGGSGEEDGQSGSFRDRWRAAKQAMNLKQKAKDKLEEKVAAPVVGILKTKLLNMIPGYGPYVTFKNAVLMRKGKFTWVDIMIMIFSNLNSCFIVLIVLTLIVLIITWVTSATGVLQAIRDLGWNGIEALIEIF